MLWKANGSLAFADRASNGRETNTLTGSGAVRWKAAEGARTNLNLNPQFAVNVTTGWNIFGANGTRTHVPNDADLGSCCELYGETINAGMFISASSRPKIANKTTHTISFDVKLMSGASDWQVGVQECDNNGNPIGANIYYDFTPTADKTRIVIQHTPVRTGTHSIIGNLYRKSSTPSTIRFTKYIIEEGAIANPAWFEPVWLDPITGILGTAHASPSVSQATAWVEEGTTNTVPDPSFENATITNYWAAGGSATISKVTTHAYLGSNGGKVSCTASASDGILQTTASAAAALTGQTWTIQSRVRAFASGDVGKNVRLGVRELTAALAFVKDNYSGAFALTDAWQTISYTVTLSGGGTTAFINPRIFNNDAVAVDFVLDAIQLEQKACATSYCLDPDTMVATPHGVSRLGDISIGDQLVGQDRNNNVVAIWPVETDAYELTLDHGVKVIASAEHRFMVSKCPFDERRRKSAGWRFRELGELIPGDYVQLSTKVNAEDGADEPDLAYVMGYLLGDGYARSETNRGQTMVQWSFGKDAADLAERVRDSFVACMPMSVYHGKHPQVKPSGDRELFLTSQNRQVFNLFADRGFPVDCGASEKTLPEHVWNYKKGDLLAFLAGMIDSDGTVDKNLNLAIVSSSKQLVVDLQRLISMRLGVHGWIQTEENVTTSYSENRNMYRVRFKMADGAALYAMGLPLKHERKAERLRMCAERDTTGQKFVEGRRRYSRIASIVPVGKRTLIDITLDPDHDFIAEGAVTHNCDGSLGTGYAWASTAHASSSTRTGADITGDPTGRILATGGEVVARASFLMTHPTVSQFMFGHSGAAFINRVYLYRNTGTRPAFRLGSSAESASSSNHANDTWGTFSLSWNGTTGAVRKNAVETPEVSSAYTGLDAVGTSMRFGSSVGADQHINGLIGPVLIASRPLTARERARLASLRPEQWHWRMLDGI